MEGRLGRVKIAAEPAPRPRPALDVKTAYDVAMATRHAGRSDPGCHGSLFGLPPGLRPEQWRLDPADGCPMQHGFTLR